MMRAQQLHFSQSQTATATLSAVNVCSLLTSAGYELKYLLQIKFDSD